MCLISLFSQFGLCALCCLCPKWRSDTQRSVAAQRHQCWKKAHPDLAVVFDFYWESTGVGKWASDFISVFFCSLAEACKTSTVCIRKCWNTEALSPAVCQHFRSWVLTKTVYVLCLLRETCPSYASINRLRLLACSSCSLLLSQMLGCSSFLKTAWQPGLAVLCLKRHGHGNVSQELIIDSEATWASFPMLPPAQYLLRHKLHTQKNLNLLSALPVLAGIS